MMSYTFARSNMASRAFLSSTKSSFTSASKVRQARPSTDQRREVGGRVSLHSHLTEKEIKLVSYLKSSNPLKTWYLDQVLQMYIKHAASLNLYLGLKIQYKPTYFLHCLASLSVDPSANCFMLKSVPPADPSLHKPCAIAHIHIAVIFIFIQKCSFLKLSVVLTTRALTRILSFSLFLYRSFSRDTPLAVINEALLALPAAWIRASTATCW